MILTNCAACAAPLALDAPRCIRCHTRYCNKTYASSLIHLQRYAEARSLLRRTIPVARRVLGESNENTLNLRWNYAIALGDPTGTLDDLREAVTMFEEMVPNVRRVLGGSNPTTLLGEEALRDARATLRAREATQSSSGGA